MSAAKSKKSGAQPTINKERKETVLDPATRNLLLSGTSSKVYKVMSTSVSERDQCNDIRVKTPM